MKDRYTKEELDRELSNMDQEDIVAGAEMFDRLLKEQGHLLTKNDYEQCLNSQSACNATGLILAMNVIRERLWNNARYLNKGAEYVNYHPILQLYAYQLAHLTHGREPIEWEGYHDAYKYCKEVVAGNILPDADWTHSIFTCYHNHR